MACEARSKGANVLNTKERIARNLFFFLFFSFFFSYRFAGMRELVQACDKLMEDLKIRVDRLKGIYERSDAMLANNPGGKYRHILLYVPLKISFDLFNYPIQASGLLSVHGM